ncbi:hypothetical protein [Paractinoplanes brasiliensis]|uniref:Uncharacterized protein n=1 Tax=Paractinoplanes brasiliensis TaxID=52695 RepID=A0A4R6J789_9ACTN|nr:hypothetical protein [Actinoplanes brasiliensis]TDO31322.1 hypothetical protein C8E87_6736 [Actinoplanes brasiliensis]GID28354.1 hypothetical protein Abr02nite_33370 [Actinoplanes brasiliensis]
MQSSSTETAAPVVEPEPAEPVPAPLILLEPVEGNPGDSGVCAADGWCD